MSVTRRVLVHGLVVDTELHLGTARPAPDGRTTDLRLRWGRRRPVPDEPGPGAVVLRTPTPGNQLTFLTVTGDDDDGRLARVHGVCDIQFDGATASVHLDPAADPGLGEIVATGILLSLVLEQRGHLVLHASAVALGGTAVGVVGSSGMGKSTVATVVAGTGASFVADDVLRVDLPADSGALVHAGSTDARLRAGSVGATGAPRVVSADGRHVVAHDRDVVAVLDLGAVVIPDRRDTDGVVLRWLAPADALLALLAHPRLTGWTVSPPVRRHFHQLAALVERVPVAVATIPPLPAFDDRAAKVLLEEALTGAVRGCQTS